MTATIIMVLSYLMLKFTFPLFVDLLTSGIKSMIPNFAKKAPWYFEIVKRLPDILGFLLLIFIIFIWTNFIN